MTTTHTQTREQIIRQANTMYADLLAANALLREALQECVTGDEAFAYKASGEQAKRRFNEINRVVAAALAKGGA